ncbi:MAG: diphosphomevalonate decarboxylase [Chloroflexi bacterium]|nr:diphosphomevalonate decarboxylase [Chloroflexota bacterium]
MIELSAKAVSHPNIAFIKYWGNRDSSLRIPVNGSISMNMAELETITTVTFTPSLSADQLTLNGKKADPGQVQRVTDFLDIIRKMAGFNFFADVVSTNNFPTGAGIASSAAAFSALALAGSKAAGLELDEKTLTRLARRGSGSASRSIPDGFVEWLPGSTDEDSYSISLASASSWDLRDVIAVVAADEKKTGSSEGHGLAGTSPFQTTRVADAPRRLSICREAIISHDFDKLAAVMELDSDMMHAVMMTSTPALFYWEPASLRIIKSVPMWRNQGIPCAYTVDAGPNVHILCPASSKDDISSRLSNMDGVVTVLETSAGGPARLLEK